jgi:hypothetical protein
MDTGSEQSSEQSSQESAPPTRVRAVHCGVDNMCILEGIDCPQQIGRGQDYASSLGQLQLSRIMPMQTMGGHKRKKRAAPRRRKKKQSGGRKRVRKVKKKATRRKRRQSGNGAKKTNLKGGSKRKRVSGSSASKGLTSTIKSIRACNYKSAPRKRV